MFFSPSSEDGQVIVEKQVQEQSKGLIKLISFEKTNGQEAEVMGVRVYKMEFQAEIEFVSDCLWGGMYGKFDAMQKEENVFTQMRGMKKGIAGQREKVSGTLLFEKTEKGWQFKPF